MGFLAAAIQMKSEKDWQANLLQAEALLKQAAASGARLAILPENAFYNGRQSQEMAESWTGRTAAWAAAIAKTLGLYLLAGSFFEKNSNGLPYNTSLFLGPDGQRISAYRKTHLFDVDMTQGPSVSESSLASPGEELVLAKANGVGCVGFSICYDLRFPELFRCLALQGAEVFLCPANFTFATGQLHWQLLLRARAAENGAYLIGAAQCGQSPTYRAYGHSMIVDPWGKVLAEGGQEPGVVMAEIDLPEVAQARRQLGMLQNRREDLYRLSAERVHFDQEEEEVGRSV